MTNDEYKQFDTGLIRPEKYKPLQDAAAKNLAALAPDDCDDLAAMLDLTDSLQEHRARQTA